MEIRKIRVDQAEIGMVVATDIYNMYGQLIIAKGTILSERTITRLRYYNINGLQVYAQENQEQPKEDSYI